MNLYLDVKLMVIHFCTSVIKYEFIFGCETDGNTFLYFSLLPTRNSITSVIYYRTISHVCHNKIVCPLGYFVACN